MSEEARLSLLDEAEFYSCTTLVDALTDLLDGRAYISECVKRAMAQGAYEEEAAARAFFASHDASLPRPSEDSLLIKPFSNKAAMATFARSSAVEEPLLLAQHRLIGPDGAPDIVHSRWAYKEQLKFFTRGALTGLEWEGVLLAGGACLGPLLPLPSELEARAFRSKNGVKEDAIRHSARLEVIQWFNGGGRRVEDNDEEPDGEPSLPCYTDRGDEKNCKFAGADIDLFLYGLSEEQAFGKVREIGALLAANGGYEAIVRTANAITFKRSWPQRHVQIILRLYESPLHILSGFDIDCCAVGFDGTDVLVLPRARLAINRSVNVVDPERESATYDYRLLKYALRGFAAAVPGYSTLVQTSELSKPRHEASGITKLCLMDQQLHTSIKGTCGFFSCKGARIDGQPYRAVTDESVNDFIRALADKDPVAGDAYGDRVLMPFLPWMQWGRDTPFEDIVRPLLVKDSYNKPPVLRSPAPVLPWIFAASSRDDVDPVGFVLDARGHPLFACLAGKGDAQITVLYTSSLPLRCEFGLPFSSAGSVRPFFFRGMMKLGLRKKSQRS
jgi:hypothetical protein